MDYKYIIKDKCIMGGAAHIRDTNFAVCFLIQNRAVYHTDVKSVKKAWPKLKKAWILEAQRYIEENKEEILNDAIQGHYKFVSGNVVSFQKLRYDFSSDSWVNSDARLIEDGRVHDTCEEAEEASKKLIKKWENGLLKKIDEHQKSLRALRKLELYTP